MRRIAGAVVALLLAASPATAQHRSADPQAGGTAKPAAQDENFGTPPVLRLAAAAARKRAATPPGPARDAAMPLADRIAIQFDLAWTGDYNGLINGEVNDKHHRRHQDVPAQSQVQGNRRAQYSRSAPCSPPRPRPSRPRSAGAWSTTPSPAHGSACRPASPEQAPGPDRHALVVGAGTGPGRDLQDQGARYDAGRGLRAAEEGAVDPQARGQPAARRISSSCRGCRA